MRTQYASTPTPSSPVISVISGDTTAAIAGTKYIWLYCRNRAGVTAFSSVVSAIIAENQGIAITLPSSIRKAASDIHQIGIVMNTSNNPAGGCVVATYPGFEIDGVTLMSLPTTINLTRDLHFALNATVANLAALPTNYRINGMRRYVASVNQYLDWSDRDTDWFPVVPQKFNPYVVDPTEEEGANVDLAKITDNSLISYPDYDVSGSLSAGVKYWIVNDGSVSVEKGKRIRISCAVANGDAASDDFKGLMKITFLGYANILTGILDTTDMTGANLNEAVDYQGDIVTNLLLPKDLPANSAYVLQVQMAFDFADARNSARQGELIKIYPYLAPNYSEYDPAYDDIGARILSVGGRRRILPNGVGLSALIADTGSGSIGYYKWRNLGAQDGIFGAIANTANQKIIITNNGACFFANTVPDTAALRAIASTVNGVGLPSAWSDPIALTSSKVLNLTVTHPTTVRSNYPDVMAGSPAVLNAGKVRIYAKNLTTSSIAVFDMPIAGGSSENLVVGSALPSSTISSLPIVSPAHGLFTPVAISASSSNAASSFTSANYQIAVAYLYENTVTAITHDTALGCVIESAGTLADVLAIARIIGEPVVDLPVLRALELTDFFSWQVRYVISEDAEYRFDPTSLVADDGDLVIRPTAIALSSPGRFKKIVTGAGGGGTANKEEIINSILVVNGEILVDTNGNVLHI